MYNLSQLDHHFHDNDEPKPQRNLKKLPQRRLDIGQAYITI